MTDENTPPAATIRVMVVDDHPVMRSALHSVLEAEEDFVVVAEADGGRAALDLFEEAKPDVILMDGSMPDMSGMETTHQLRQRDPGAKVIGLTLYEQTTYLEEMIRVGARGYVLKTGSPRDITKAIRIVAAGGTCFDPSIPRRAAESAAAQKAIDAALDPEELAVAKLVAQGQTNAEIAETLGLAPKEVTSRRAAAMKKLGLRTRAQLVRLANERHWLD